MPNGGSDCCGTCWFNTTNKGEAGYDHTDDPEPDYCSIRQTAIENPFYTYCGNHPHRRPDKDPIPIGPIYVAPDGDEREPWKSSPDNEDVRDHLLKLLAEISEVTEEEYPIGSYTEDLVVWQLGEFREERAVPDLKRIIQFDTQTETGRFCRRHETLVANAKEALTKIGANA